MDTSQNNGLWTMTKGEFEESVRKVEAAVAKRGGNPRQLFDRIRTDESFTDRIAEFMLRGGLEGSVHHKLARAIMGKNFFGVEEWSTLYGVNFSKKQLREVAEFPWGEDILNAPCPFIKGKSIRETHFAFLGLNAIGGKSLTIIKWWKLHPATGQPCFYYAYAPKTWSAKEKFANEPTCGFRWYLMPLEIVPNSTGKTYQQQVAILPVEYEVPFAIEEVSKGILFYKKNGIYLNPQRWGWCQDVTSGGGRVVVGLFGARGLSVDCWSDGLYDSYIGLAASRKFPVQITK